MNPINKLKISLLLTLLSLLSYGQIGPGGISQDNILWLKANNGLDLLTPNVSIWQDQSLLGNNATQTDIASRPIVYTHAHNYNPSVYFNGTPKHLKLNNLLDPLNTGFNLIAVATNEPGETVSTPTSYHAIMTGQTSVGWASGGYGLSTVSLNPSDYGLWVNNSLNHSSTTGIIGGLGMNAYLLEGEFNANNITFYRNANAAASSPYTGNVGASPGGGQTLIGGSGSGSTDNHVGHIAEVIMYSNPLTNLERHRINSYLGIKYGITLDRNGVNNNYITSSGTIIYEDLIEEGINGMFWNGIIGIGRDDNSVLEQKQSHTHYDNCRIYLKDLEIDNITNTGSFPTNEEFIILGNNDELVSATIESNKELPSVADTLNARLAREWKVTNTNYLSTYSIDIQFNSCVDVAAINPSDLRLLIDDDSNFTNATVHDGTTAPYLTLNVAERMITIKDIPNTLFTTNTSTYFTIASTDDINDVFEALPIADIHTCDDKIEDGITEFTIDHSSIENQVIGNQEIAGNNVLNFTVSYFDENGNEYGEDITPDFSNLYTNLSNPQTIIVRITNALGCYDETELQLIVDPLPLVDEIDDFISCGPFELPEYTNPNNTYYTNDPDSGGIAMVPGEIIDSPTPITIYIQAEDPITGCTKLSNFEFHVVPPPIIDNSMMDVSACGSYELPILTDGDYYTELDGPNGIGNLLLPGDNIVTTSTIYVYASLTTDGQTCIDQYSFEVNILPIYEFDLSLDNIIINNQVNVEVNLENLPIDYEYQLEGENFQSDNQFFNLDSGNHTLTVRTKNECTEHSINFWITIFYIPEFFSPNNDGINDYWKITDSDNTITSIKIYDRFGKNIANIDPYQGWDGNVNNIPAPSSDYWYVIEITTDHKVLKGNFTLKR